MFHFQRNLITTKEILDIHVFRVKDTLFTRMVARGKLNYKLVINDKQVFVRSQIVDIFEILQKLAKIKHNEKVLSPKAATSNIEKFASYARAWRTET